LLLAGTATLLVASACTTISAAPTIPPIPTVPPINIPSIPPITIPTIPPLPSINIPTIPPINIPSGITIPTIPPIDLPSIDIPEFSFPPIEIPTSATPCALVTSAEVGQILGEQVTDSSGGPTSCVFITPSFSTMSISTDTSTDLSGVQFLMGNTAQQVTVGGLPGISGTVLGLPALYVQKPSGQLQILGFSGDDADFAAKLQQIAAIAVGRMP